MEKQVKKAIDEAIGNGAKKLSLRINSPGGVCTQAVAMRSILANAGFEEINILIEGLCASAATDLATLPGAHVAISEGSEYMIHNPWCIAFGNANEMEHTIERLRNIEQMSRGFYMKRTGQTEEQIKEWMDAETWFTAEEAVEYGFADEVISAEVVTETPAAACVSERAMTAMRGLYKAVPTNIAIESETLSDGATAPENEEVSNGTPVAGAPTEINLKEDNPMELDGITMDQLRDGNPALFEQVQQNAVAAERERISDIDALTVPGYEAMAEEAKANGTSAMDFQKQIVAAMKEKGGKFMQARQEETAPAQDVTGGAPETGLDEDKEIKKNAEAIAEYAKAYAGRGDGGMF